MKIQGHKNALAAAANSMKRQLLVVPRNDHRIHSCTADLRGYPYPSDACVPLRAISTDRAQLGHPCAGFFGQPNRTVSGLLRPGVMVRLPTSGTLMRTIKRSESANDSSR